MPTTPCPAGQSRKHHPISCPPSVPLAACPCTPDTNAPGAPTPGGVPCPPPGRIIQGRCRQPGVIPPGGCDPTAQYEQGHPCFPGSQPRIPPPAPPERAAGDMPCPDPGTCKDVVTGQCRTFNPNREKVNMTDTWERPSGGGRGYCRQRDGGGRGGGGAGGAGGGVGGPGGPNSGISDPRSRFNDLYGMFDNNANKIWDNLVPIMSGTQTRYSPEVMAQLDAAAKMNAMGQSRAGMDSLRQDAIQRGVGRSPIRGMGEVQRGAVQSYTQATNQNRVMKAEKDFEDRMTALNAAQRWLGQMQTYVMGLDATSAQREQAIANIALGYARIASEERMLRESLRNNLEAIDRAGLWRTLQP